mgnify:CR=1 FL=1
MKKNTLFKVIAIMFLVFAVLSWIIPASQASGSEIMDMNCLKCIIYEDCYSWVTDDRIKNTVKRKEVYKDAFTDGKHKMQKRNQKKR